jgi:hypothetical protein
VAKLVGILWIPVGLIVAFVSKQAGYPQASGWLFIAAGLAMVWIVGRRYGLSGKRTWARAVIGSFVVLALVGSAVLWLWAMSGTPGLERTQ